MTNLLTTDNASGITTRRATYFVSCELRGVKLSVVFERLKARWPSLAPLAEEPDGVSFVRDGLGFEVLRSQSSGYLSGSMFIPSGHVADVLIRSNQGEEPTTPIEIFTQQLRSALPFGDYEYFFSNESDSTDPLSRALLLELFSATEGQRSGTERRGATVWTFDTYYPDILSPRDALLAHAENSSINANAKYISVNEVYERLVRAAEIMQEVIPLLQEYAQMCAKLEVLGTRLSQSEVEG